MKKNVFRKGLSVFLAFLMIFTLLPSNFVSVSINAAPTYSNYLDGWRVAVAWSTLSTDYIWNANRSEMRQPKIYVTFNIDNATRDYEPGQLKFTIPGVDDAYRGGTLKAQDIAADKADSEWSYIYNETTSTYTFTNNFKVEAGSSHNGGFEFMWTFNSRSNTDGFIWTGTPIFSISGTINESIELPPLTYQFTSERDRYRIYLTKTDLSASEWGESDRDYTWYNIEHRIEGDWLSRGLYRSDYFVYFDLPEGCTKDDIIVQYGGKTITLVENVDGKPGFYLWDDKSGDIISQYNTTYRTTMVVGFLKDKFEGKELIIHSHLDRLYNDEKEWVTTATPGTNEIVDRELKITVESYSFSYDGHTYSIEKRAPYSYYNWGKSAPTNYRDRLNASNIYSGKIVEFSLYGSAKRDYYKGYNLNGHFITPLNNSFMDTDSYDLSDEEVIAIPTGIQYGDIYNSKNITSKAKEFKLNNINTFADLMNIDSDIAPTSISGIEENGKYDMLYGDDKLAIVLESGAIRELSDEEYNIDYIRVPYIGNYTYEIWAADTQNKNFNEYELIGTYNGSVSRTIRTTGQGYKVAFVRVKDIVGNFSTWVYFGIEFNLNWNEVQESGDPPNHEGNIVNFNYLRALYNTGDEDNPNWHDDILDVKSYGGSYGSKLQERDIEWYGSKLFRDYADVYLRTSTTNLETSVTLGDTSLIKGSADRKGTISATGSVIADEEGSLKKFSLYVIIPEGMITDFDMDEISVTGSGLFETGDSPSVFMDYCNISEGTYNGQKMVILDFDFTDTPLEISNKTSVSVNFPVYLTRSNYIVLGNYYTAYSYFMIHDEGIDRITGTNLLSDSYDIDSDGSRNEYMVRNSSSRTIFDDVSEWRENINKYVKTAYSDGYASQGITRLYNENMSEEEAKYSNYSYRLDYELGSNAAKNIIFYDSIETGADLKVAGDSGDETVNVSTEWHGEFVSIDASNLLKQGATVNYYWSSDPDMMKKSTEGDSPTGINTEGWTQTDANFSDVDKSLVRSVAIQMNTDSMTNGVLQSPGIAYVIINMRAPLNSEYIGKEAVNQYMVAYNAYDISGFDLGMRNRLSSDATYVTLRESIASLVLQKVDADNVIRVDASGNNVYSRITEGKFNIYLSDKETLIPGYDWPMDINSMGRIVLRNIEYGKYYWEEVEAPNGYEKVDGKHEIILSDSENIFEVLNRRIRGSVTLTKNDTQFMGYGPLNGAKFELYTAEGLQVFTDENYAYSDDINSDNLIGEFITDNGGKIEITNLPWGSYYFVEVESPNGYLINSTHIKFNIGKAQYDEFTDTIHTEVTISNNEDTATIRLIKLDSTNNDFVEGAQFSLYRKQRGTETADVLIKSGLRTNTVGEIEIEGLQFGEYYFVETRNGAGYKMPDAENAKTDTVTLDVTTVNQTVKVEFNNDRMVGSVMLMKLDDFGQYVSGATYKLCYKPDTSNTDNYSEIGRYTTSGEEATFVVSNLEWGDYYFEEVEAPLGYAVSEEIYTFTIDKKTVQNQIFIEAVDSRTLGSVQIIKTEKDNPEVVLGGAEFDLFDINGNPMIAGTDYETERDDNKIITATNGTIIISKLKQGGYYLQETVAPNGYSKLSDPIRFSVTLENSQAIQVLNIGNEKGKATITINKEINEVYDDFGNPTFIFSVTNKDTGRVYKKSITLSELQLSGSITFTVDANYKYDIYEYESARYNLVDIIDNENIEDINIEKNFCVADLTGGSAYAEVTYANNMEQYEKLSDSSNVVNIVRKQMKLTGMRVEYVGLNPISDENMKDERGHYIVGYDPDTEEYTFQEDDLIVIVYYDDGSSRVLSHHEYQLDKPSVNGGSGNTSETITVTHIENGITVTDTFQVGINLKYTKRYIVTFDCNGGTIIPDENWP